MKIPAVRFFLLILFDIAFEFGKVKMTVQLSVGFALETEDELKNAMGKLARKNFDMVVLNSMNDAEAGFGFDTNQINIIKKDFSRKVFPLKPKSEVAADILMEVAACMEENATGGQVILYNSRHSIAQNFQTWTADMKTF